MSDQLKGESQINGDGKVICSIILKDNLGLKMFYFAFKFYVFRIEQNAKLFNEQSTFYFSKKLNENN